MDCPQCNLNNSPQASTCVRCGADLQSKNSRSSPVMSFRPIGSTASQTPPSRSGSAYHPRQDAQSSYKPGQSAYGSNQGYQPQDYRTPANPANYAGQGSTYGQSNPAQNTWSQPTYQSPASYNQPNAPYYGAGQAAGIINCPSCASLLPAGTQVCFNCGVPMAMAGMISDKDKTIVLIICIALGVIGGHHFYVGNTGKGVLYLFTGGLLGFGVIIDVINILNGSFTDNLGRRLRNR